MSDNTSDPTVSVIIPTFNRANLIGRAIGTVLNQTFQDFEITVVDDCSKDNTEEIVTSFSDNRVNYIRHNQNLGGSASRNTGIINSEGKYVAFLDSDDEWLREKLEKQINLFQKSENLGLVYCLYKRDDSAGVAPTDPLRGSVFYQELWQDRLAPTSTVMLKKEVLYKCGFFDTDMPARQDYDLWLRVTQQYEVDYVEKPLAVFHTDCENSKDRISASLKSVLEGNELVSEKIKDFTQLNQPLRRRVLAYHNYRQALVIGIRSADFKRARGSCREAIIKWPFNPTYWVIFTSMFYNGWLFNKLLDIREYLRSI